MAEFILPLTDPAAIDPENVGPKAANLASLTQNGLPTPGGFALTAEAYRHQLRHLGIEPLLTEYNEGDLRATRRLSIQIRLAIYQQPIAPEILAPLAGSLAGAARRRHERGGALFGADRGPQGRQLRRPVRKLPRPHRRNRIPHRGARLLGPRWTSHARRYMENHYFCPPIPPWAC